MIDPWSSEAGASDLALAPQRQDVEFLDSQIPEPRSVDALHVGRPADPLRGRLYLRPEPLSELDRRGHPRRSEEHTSELQSQSNLVCRLLLEKKKNTTSVTN